MLYPALFCLLVVSCSSSPTGDKDAATPSSSSLRTYRTSPDLMTHVNPPMASLAATAQYRGATAITITEQGPSLEEYENFFHLVDNLLWDSEEEEGRGFRRGWLGRPRPQLLMRRNGQAAPFYRAIVDQCYDLMCQLGINGLINRMSRMLSLR